MTIVAAIAFVTDWSVCTSRPSVCALCVTPRTDSMREEWYRYGVMRKVATSDSLGLAA